MNSYLESIKKQFEYYKTLGEKTFDQIPEDKLFWKPNTESNSIAVIVKHLQGNMLSRWTDFLTTDGEKEWRHRDQEFDDDIHTKTDLLKKWNTGWDCLFNTLNTLTQEDLEHIVYIRNMGHTVTEAINRQLAHYAYHIGQIVFIGILIKNTDWKSLSVPKGESNSYNKEKFAKPQRREHFTDDL